KKIDGRAIRHAIEVRHASFVTPELPALARKYGVAIVHAGDSRFPEIDDADSPFVYARIMGTTEKHKLGYPARDLDRWAARATAWAAGGREVFLYVISGFKERNPAAAMALIERVSSGACSGIPRSHTFDILRAGTGRPIPRSHSSGDDPACRSSTMSKAWVILIFAGLLEVGWAVGLK